MPRVVSILYRVLTIYSAIQNAFESVEPPFLSSPYFLPCFLFSPLYNQKSQLVNIAAMVWTVGSTSYTAHQTKNRNQHDASPPYHSSSLLQQQPESGYMCFIDMLKGGKFVLSTLASCRKVWTCSASTQLASDLCLTRTLQDSIELCPHMHAGTVFISRLHPVRSWYTALLDRFAGYHRSHGNTAATTCPV
jgi:hypothetical protein